MDPPYQGVSSTRDNRYMAGLDRTRFERSLHLAIEQDTSFIVSYDVVTETNIYGEQLSPELGLVHLHVMAGRSSQATLQGRARVTIESLYLSPALVDRLGGASSAVQRIETGPPQAAVAAALF
jgi:DNA adenine methylase